MKQGRALADVLTELKTQEAMKRDFIVPANKLHLDDAGDTFEMQMANGLTTELFATTDLFHRQLGTALNIPARYYEQMRTQKPELLATNVNTWLDDRDTSYMVRSFDNGSTKIARAFLSDRYRRIDNIEVATAVLPLFAGRDGIEVVSSEITENKLYLKVVNHRIEMEVVPGDVVQAGVIISNSEVGLGAVSVQPLVYRLVCTNGMVVNDLAERKAHVGRTTRAIEASYDVYSDETLMAEDKAFMLKLRDVTQAAIDVIGFTRIVERLQESTSAMITGRVTDVVELTGKAYDLNGSEQDSVLNYLIAGGDLSLYGLGNAITRASQDVDSYDRATVLEGVGWDVVTMPMHQWKDINR